MARYVRKVTLSVVRTFGADCSVRKRSAGLVWGLMLGGELAVLQAPMFDGLSFDSFPLFDDGCIIETRD